MYPSVESGKATAEAAGGSSFDVTKQKDLQLLKPKAVGLVGVLFLTLTGAAPMTASLLNIPIVVGNGNGYGAPAAFLVATLILLLFSVGYAAMASKVSAVGGFYSFISHGLGRELGMAFGFCAVAAYAIFEPALAGGLSYFLNLKLNELFGINVPWAPLAVGMVVLISVLTYFEVQLSAALLGVALVAEVLILLFFDLGIFAHAGHGVAVSASALNPLAAFQGFAPDGKLLGGAAGIGLFFAFWSWVGFEMAPNYAEESVNPKKIVPISLYVSVICLGVFYTVTSWAVVSSYPDFHSLIEAAQNNSATFFFDPATKLLGPWVTSLMSYLVLTSSFACGMAFHNTAARYLYALGREGVFPKALARTHVVHKTPYVASIVQSAIAILVIAAFAIFIGSDNPQTDAYAGLFSLMALMGTILVLSAQAVVSLAVIVYFKNNHASEAGRWSTFVAPLLAFLSQAFALYLCATNMEFLGGGFAFADWIIPLDIAIFAVGLAGAFLIKTTNPAKFEKIGRLIYQGVPEGMLASAEHAAAAK
ncbi:MULTISPECIES: APC family permease [unclassified Hyphomicrobium]|uniref:APC family permease n=1 Tax=unclassified Hyphomicrobium TaxID=2619925 RepID=UPI000213E482|nr:MULTISPECIES: APC family permease [unclassified Hyphomicrobium]CCB67127.1 putative amino acid permease [Hyphomicrobium sp. MC1]